MRNKMPKKCKKKECGVINLDNADGSGTHWVAYFKYNKNVYYFDSFGNLRPPKEFIDFVDGTDSNIFFNYKQYQDYNTVYCGHLCLMFLEEMNKKFI